MKCIDVYFVSLGPDKLLEPSAHGYDAGIGVSEAKNILRKSICFEQDLTDARGKNLGFPRAGTRDHEYRPLDCINSQFLFFIQLAILLVKSLFNELLAE